MSKLNKSLLGWVNPVSPSGGMGRGYTSNKGIYSAEQIKQSCALNKNIETMLQTLMDNAGLDCDDVTACITTNAGTQGAIKLVIETYLAEPVGDGNISRLCELSQDCFQNALEGFIYDDVNNQFTVTLAASFDDSNGFLTITGAWTVADPFVVVPWPDFCAQVEACIVANGLPVGVELFTLDWTVIETGDVLTTTNEITIAGNTITSTVNGVSDDVDVTASNVSYDNATSGLTATDTQAAIDELASDSHVDDDVETVTWSVVDNTDARNPVINAASPADITWLQTQIDGNDTDIAALQALAHADDDVETISGSVVDNTDPRNPIINAVTPAEALLLQTQITGNDVDIAALQVNSHVDDDVETVTGTAVDVTDPRNPVINFQNASNTAIADVAGNYTATDVEWALAEIATSITWIAHTSITSIDLQPTANANEYTVVITWVDENSVTQTTVDATPITITWGTDLWYTASPTDGTVTSTTWVDTTLPVVDGTNAWLATPAMFTNSHADDDVETVTGTAVDNTDPRNPVINLQTAAQTSFDNVASGLTATDTQAAIDELASNQGDTSVVTQTVTVGNEIASHSDWDVTTTPILETITTVVPATDSNWVITYVYTNEVGATVTIDPKVILEDEDGNIELVDWSTDTLHRTLHIDQWHLGSGIGTSFADSHWQAMSAITTNHQVVAIATLQWNNSAVRSIITWARPNNSWTDSIVAWVDVTNSWERVFANWLRVNNSWAWSRTWWEDVVNQARRSFVMWEDINVLSTNPWSQWMDQIAVWLQINTNDAEYSATFGNNQLNNASSALQSWSDGITRSNASRAVNIGLWNQVWDWSLNQHFESWAIGRNNTVYSDVSFSIWATNIITWDSRGSITLNRDHSIIDSQNSLAVNSDNEINMSRHSFAAGQGNVIDGLWVVQFTNVIISEWSSIQWSSNSWIIWWTNHTVSHDGAVIIWWTWITSVRWNQTHAQSLWLDIVWTWRVYVDDTSAWVAWLVQWEIYWDNAWIIRYKL